MRSAFLRSTQHVPWVRVRCCARRRPFWIHDLGGSSGCPGLQGPYPSRIGVTPSGRRWRGDGWQTVRVTTLELQLLLPDGLSATAVADTLAGEVPVVTHKAHSIERTFWDTFDGRVHAAGLALVAAGGRLALSDATTYAEQ